MQSQINLRCFSHRNMPPKPRKTKRKLKNFEKIYDEKPRKTKRKSKQNERSCSLSPPFSDAIFHVVFRKKTRGKNEYILNQQSLPNRPSSNIVLLELVIKDIYIGCKGVIIGCNSNRSHNLNRSHGTLFNLTIQIN